MAPDRLSYDRNAEKDQEIGEEFLNPDKDMEEAASVIQGHFRVRQAKKKANQTEELNAFPESEEDPADNPLEYLEDVLTTYDEEHGDPALLERKSLQTSPPANVPKLDLSKVQKTPVTKLAGKKKYFDQDEIENGVTALFKTDNEEDQAI